MDVFYDRPKLGSTAALDCHTGQNKCRYREKELLFLLVSMMQRDLEVETSIICKKVRKV